MYLLIYLTWRTESNLLRKGSISTFAYFQFPSPLRFFYILLLILFLSARTTGKCSYGPIPSKPCTNRMCVLSAQSRRYWYGNCCDVTRARPEQLAGGHRCMPTNSQAPARAGRLVGVHSGVSLEWGSGLTGGGRVMGRLGLSIGDGGQQHWYPMPLIQAWQAPWAHLDLHQQSTGADLSRSIEDKAAVSK